MSNTSATIESSSASKKPQTKPPPVGSPALEKLRTDTKQARQKFNDDSDGVRASMMQLFEEHVLPSCDNAEVNVDFYRRFLNDITGVDQERPKPITDLREFALRIPAFIRVAHDKLRGINVEDPPAPKTTAPGQRLADKIDKDKKPPSPWSLPTRI